MSNRRVCVLSLIALLLIPSVSKAEVPRLHEVYSDYFLIGVAHGLGPQYSRFDDLVAYHFNVITPENLMKWNALQPQPGVFNFEAADAFVDFAHENGLKVIGHVLIWHEQTPAWVFQDEDGNPASRELLIERMETHIKQVVGHFKGRVHGWDVVNEAVEGGDLRDSPWRQIIGDDYIALAFQFAHEADPDAELYYNDFNLVEGPKRARVYRLIQDLQQQGIRIDGVGMQAHYDITWPSPELVSETIQYFASLGVAVHITELDISVYPWSDRRNLYSDGLPDDIAARQAARYAELFEVFRTHADVIERVTLWGVSDDMSWKNYYPVRRRDYPLLFDSAGEPKPAFWAIIPTE